MYLPRSYTGNIFPSWTVVVRRHHVYVREFHLPSCNSAAVDIVTYSSSTIIIIMLAILQALSCQIRSTWHTLKVLSSEMDQAEIRLIR
jgi:hypothetical protein